MTKEEQDELVKDAIKIKRKTNIKFVIDNIKDISDDKLDKIVFLIKYF